MILELKDFRSKVMGCWMGKNIGGSLGGPFECKRGEFNVDFYTQDLKGEPLPNDDLDLQLVWLNVLEKYGKNTNASILGEYWHSFIVPNWGEYGAGKNNMRMGLVPPLSGLVNNVFRDSNGAFIRSEIWACTAPGNPEIAVKYAYEDAIVDHTGEGVYGEIFCAAIESAAFVESDKYKLINIGLSYIPKDCGIAKAVATVIDCYNKGKTWQETRKILLNVVPGSFGILGTLPEDMEKDIPIGDIGWDAPSNIGIMIIGWLFGEDDFSKSLCIATNCGEDADCTAGTLGSIIGIIKGIEGIPEKWTEPLGGKIKTISLNLGDQGIIVPKTIEELTERTLRVTPLLLGSEICDFINSKNGYTIKMEDADRLAMRDFRVNAWVNKSFSDILIQSPFTTKHEFTILNAYLNYHEAPLIFEGKEMKFTLTLENNFFIQQWINVKWHLPEGFEITPSKNVAVSLEQYHCNIGKTDLEFTVTCHNLDTSRYDLLIEISSVGRHTKCVIPVVLINS